jgi:hypothetical protein
MEIAVILGVAIVIFGSIFLLLHLLRLRAERARGEQPDPEVVKRAVEIIWVQTYGMRLDQLPRIVFVTGKQLNCAGGLGWNDPRQGCVAGLSWEATRTCSVAYYPGAKMHIIALAHELWHAAGWLLGDDDPTHTGPGFQPGGAVEKANVALAAVNL